MNNSKNQIIVTGQPYASDAVVLPNGRKTAVTKFSNCYRFSNLNMLKNIGTPDKEMHSSVKFTVKRLDIESMEYHTESMEGQFDFSKFQLDNFDMKVAETGCEYSIEFNDYDILILKYPIGWGLIFFNTLKENLFNVAELIYQNNLFWEDWRSASYTDCEREQWEPYLIGKGSESV